MISVVSSRIHDLFRLFFLIWILSVTSTLGGVGWAQTTPSFDSKALKAELQKAQEWRKLLEASNFDALKSSLPGFEEAQSKDWDRALGERIRVLEAGLGLLEKWGELPGEADLRVELRNQQAALKSLEKTPVAEVPGEITDEILELKREQYDRAHQELADVLKRLGALTSRRNELSKELGEIAGNLETLSAAEAPKEDAPILEQWAWSTGRLELERGRRLKLANERLSLEDEVLQADHSRVQFAFERVRDAYIELNTARFQRLDLAGLKDLLDREQRRSRKLHSGDLNLEKDRKGENLLPSGFREGDLEPWKVVVEERENQLARLLETQRAFAGLSSQQALQKQLSEAQDRVSRQKSESSDLPADFGSVEKLEEYLVAKEKAVERVRAASLELEADLIKKEERAKSLESESKTLPQLEAEIRGALKSSGASASDGLGPYRTVTQVLQLVAQQQRGSYISKAISEQGLRQQISRQEQLLANLQLGQAEALLEKARIRLNQQIQPQMEALAREALAAYEKALLLAEPEVRLDRQISYFRLALNLAQTQRRRIRKLLEKAKGKGLALETEHGQLSKHLDLKRRGATSNRTVKHLRTRLEQVRSEQEEIEDRDLPQVWNALDETETSLSEILTGVFFRADSGQLPPGALLGKRRTHEQEMDTLRVELDGMVEDLAKLEALYLDQHGKLGQIYKRIVRRVYWMRTDSPLGQDLLSRIPSEMREVWFRLVLGKADEQGSRDKESLWTQVGKSFSGHPWRAAGGILGLLSLLMAGIFSWKTQLEPPRWKYRGGLFLTALQRLVVLLAISGASPACFVGAAFLLRLAALPPEIDTPLFTLLFGLAAVLFARRFLILFFRPGGVAANQLRVKATVLDQLQRASQRVTRLGMWFWLPWVVLRSEPLELVAVPRLLYTAMLFFGALILIRIVRPGGALIQEWTEGKGFWYRAWSLVFPAVSLSFFGIVGMDSLGYRVGAWVFTQTVLQLVVGLVLLAYVRALCTRVVSRAAFAVIAHFPLLDAGPGEDHEDPETQAKIRAERFRSQVPQMSHMVGTAVIVIGVLLVAWSLDLVPAVREFCVGVPLSQEYGVTLWSVVQAAAWILGGHFLLFHLKTFCELFVFTRLGAVDGAMQYVILTLSRYAIVIVSYTAALLALRVPLTSVAWLMTALSVGIGFGLREIIANFVSGLILLIERPIRVGDIVKVGEHLGVVKKINIRATLVENFDRLSIIVPNCQLISESVTNWTYENPIMRRQIQVGVAYGTDVVPVLEMLEGIVKAHPMVLQDPPPNVLFEGFGDSSLDLRVRFYAQISDGLTACSELRDQIYNALDKAGVAIPFPQRDLHIISSPSNSGEGEELSGEAWMLAAAANPIGKDGAVDEGGGAPPAEDGAE
ncbi:MAG: mechanosensitive ion channel [Planctomycetota bacterium]|nr:mechanosensitive ion channel [Planctomycetota bacterium]